MPIVDSARRLPRPWWVWPLEHLQLAASVLMFQDIGSARRLVSEKERFRDLERAVRAGENDVSAAYITEHISKPVQWDSFFRTLSRLIEERSDASGPDCSTASPVA